MSDISINEVKRTGIFWAIIFSLGLILNSINVLLIMRTAPEDYLVRPTTLVLTLMIAICLASAYVSRLAFIQPLVFFIGTFMSMTSPDGGYASIYSFGFFIVAVATLFRMGFFEKHKLLKFALSVGFLFSATLTGAYIAKRSIYYAFSPIFFVSILILFFYFAFKERLVVYLKEPKPILSLSEKKLSPAEKLYIHQNVAGKQAKEIAVDFEVSESTVRNTLNRAYAKIGVPGQSEFLVLAATSEIRD